MASYQEAERRIYRISISELDAYQTAMRTIAAANLTEERVAIGSEKGKIAAALGWLAAFAPFAFGSLSVGGLWAMSGMAIEHSISPLSRAGRPDVLIENYDVSRAVGHSDRPLIVIRNPIGDRIGEIIAAVPPRAPVVPNPPTNVTVQ